VRRLAIGLALLAVASAACRRPPEPRFEYESTVTDVWTGDTTTTTLVPRRGWERPQAW
jgi:hypothetical protein